MLPVASAIGKLRVSALDPFRSWPQNLKQICTGMPTTLFDNLDTHTFSWDPSRYEEYASLVTTYGIASVGKICKFYINAHVHLGGISRHSTSLMSVTSFQRFCIFLFLHYVNPTITA